MLMKRLVLASTAYALFGSALAVASPTTDAEKAVNGFCQQGNVPSGDNVVLCPLYTVPAGKRLIVESVSWSITQVPTNTFSQLIFGLDVAPVQNTVNFLPSARTVFIQHSPTYGDNTTTSSQGTQSVKMVFEAGEIFAGEYYYASGPNFVQTFSFQGRLVNP